MICFSFRKLVGKLMLLSSISGLILLMPLHPMLEEYFSTLGNISVGGAIVAVFIVLLLSLLFSIYLIETSRNKY